MESASITSHIINAYSAITAPNRTTDSGELYNDRGYRTVIEDKVSLSREGKDQISGIKPSLVKKTSSADQQPDNLEEQELKELQQLKIRDTEVRTHEQAHLSAVGRYARGGASFTYQRGPDGGSYAISGEVGIDVAKESTPEATINKMQTIKRAALAPANPSAADKQIAARASALEAQARQELFRNQQQELDAGREHASSPITQTAGQSNSSAIKTSNNINVKTKLAVYQLMAAS